MSSEQPAPAARRGGADAGLSLAGLIDVLDRADAMLPRQRPRPRRAAAHRGAGRAAGRGVALRPVPPLRAKPPAPAPRPAAPEITVVVVPDPPTRRGLRASLGALTRRLALWGAGADGEHLASWSPARPPRRPAPAPRGV